MCINIVIQKLFISELSFLLISNLKICLGFYRLSSRHCPIGIFSESWPACYGSSMSSYPDISQKYKTGDRSKGVANTL